MSATDHPCSGMSAAAVKAFELIAINEHPPMNKRAIDQLLKLGLIERLPDKELRDRFGSYSIPQYQVPLAIHMQWCNWASEQPEPTGAA